MAQELGWSGNLVGLYLRAVLAHFDVQQKRFRTNGRPRPAQAPRPQPQWVLFDTGQLYYFEAVIITAVAGTISPFTYQRQTKLPTRFGRSISPTAVPRCLNGTNNNIAFDYLPNHDAELDAAAHQSDRLRGSRP